MTNYFIVKTLSESEFMDELKRDEYANWSYEATRALYDYYDQLADDLQEPIEFDPVAIRCDWNEYDSLKEAYDQYEPVDEAEATDDDSYRAYFEDRTTVIELDNGHVLVEAF